MTPQRELVRVGIIGAGASGLAQLKQLIDAFDRPQVRARKQLQVSVFEKNGEVGGVWLADEQRPKSYRTAKLDCSPQDQPTVSGSQGQLFVYPPMGEDPSPMYQGLRTNLPHDLMAFRDLPMPSGLPTFPSRAQTQAYLETYARTFDLHRHIRFNTTMRRLYRKSIPSSSASASSSSSSSPHRLPSNTRRWIVEYSGPDGADQDEFDFVCCANGHYADGWIPEIPGLASFSGEILHSRFFRSALDYPGQKVLVVGSFASGGDISRLLAAYNIGMYTSEADHDDGGRPGSLVEPNKRIDVHISCSAPSQYSVDPTDESTPWGKYVTYHPIISHISNGLPTPPPSASSTPSPMGTHDSNTASHRIHPGILSGIAQSSVVHFEDGSSLSDIDTIIFATGYNFAIPFAKSTDEPWTSTPLFSGRIRDGERAGGQKWEEGGVKGMGVEGLDELMLFLEGDRSLCFPVMQYQVVPFPLAEVQTRFSSLLWAGLLPNLPKKLCLPSNASNPYSTPPPSPPAGSAQASSGTPPTEKNDQEGTSTGAHAAGKPSTGRGQRRVMQTRQKLVFGAPYEWTYSEYLMSLMAEADEDEKAGAGPGCDEGEVRSCWRRVEGFRRDRRADTGLRKRILGY